MKQETVTIDVESKVIIHSVDGIDHCKWRPLKDMADEVAGMVEYREIMGYLYDVEVTIKVKVTVLGNPMMVTVEDVNRFELNGYRGTTIVEVLSRYLMDNALQDNYLRDLESESVYGLVGADVFEVYDQQFSGRYGKLTMEEAESLIGFMQNKIEFDWYSVVSDYISLWLEDGNYHSRRES